MSTTIDWPSSLPGLPMDSWGYASKSAMLQTDMEVGPPKRRMRTTTTLDKISGTLELDSSQVTAYKAFVRDTLSYGTLSFNFPDYLSSSDVEVVLAIGSGEDLYNISQTGKNTFQIELNLEIVPS